MIAWFSIWFWIACLGLFGAIFGSFAGAQVWRIRARQLRDEDLRLAELKKQSKLSKEDNLDKSELSKTKAQRQAERKRLDSLLGRVGDDYSRCLSCQHRLAWYDLLPLASWVSTRGRCRYCGVKIGGFEPLMEIGLASFFVASLMFWPVALDVPLEIVQFIIWLLAGVALAVLFAYDAKWFLLPDVAMAPFIVLAAIYAGLELVQTGLSVATLGSLLGSLAVLSGIYLLLHLASRGSWVGYGDVTLGAGLALLIGRVDVAVVALFLANLIGALLVLPPMLAGRLDRKSVIPFGPLLIIGAVLAHFWGGTIVNWYTSLL